MFCFLKPNQGSFLDLPGFSIRFCSVGWWHSPRNSIEGRGLKVFELQILKKIYAPQAENVPLRINSFCVPFWATIGRTKTFKGREKILMGGKGPHNGKTCPLEEALSTLSNTPSCNYDHFTIAFAIIKLRLLPQNGHY